MGNVQKCGFSCVCSGYRVGKFSTTYSYIFFLIGKRENVY